MYKFFKKLVFKNKFYENCLNYFYVKKKFLLLQKIIN